jgi:hypothetical protein
MLADKLRSLCSTLPAADQKKYALEQISEFCRIIREGLDDEEAPLHRLLVSQAQSTPGAGGTYLEIHVTEILGKSSTTPRAGFLWVNICEEGFLPYLKGAIATACASTGVTVTLEGKRFDAVRFLWAI